LILLREILDSFSAAKPRQHLAVGVSPRTNIHKSEEAPKPRQQKIEQKGSRRFAAKK
jgi:hypothetical protein